MADRGIIYMIKANKVKERYDGSLLVVRVNVLDVENSRLIRR